MRVCVCVCVCVPVSENTLAQRIEYCDNTISTIHQETKFRISTDLHNNPSVPVRGVITFVCMCLCVCARLCVYVSYAASLNTDRTKNVPEVWPSLRFYLRS